MRFELANFTMKQRKILIGTFMINEQLKNIIISE